VKFKDEFNLGDISDSVLNSYRYNGHLYVLPHTVNVMLFFYRDDVLKQAGKAPPQTIPDYVELAKTLNTPMRAGTISCLKPVDASLNETHWYVSALGDGWFDDKWKPVFNDEKGVAAVETLKRATQYAQRGFSSAANDECMLALQQDLAAMGLQWATRAAAMDDPKKSRVTGKMDWMAAPSGHARVSGDGYALSAFSKQDPELLFRIIATSSSEASMREAAALMVPPRQSVLRDPALAQQYRYYPAILASLDTAVPFPALPEFYEVGEFISRRVLQAVNGEMGVKEALDAAAGETEQLLKSRGYYG
jgi:ABC-type glycerol-3-phosphate transport system substrate-binding protein